MEISKQQFDQALKQYAESLQIIESYTKQVFSAPYFETAQHNKYKSFADLVPGNRVEIVELHKATKNLTLGESYRVIKIRKNDIYRPDQFTIEDDNGNKKSYKFDNSMFKVLV